jgi:hypothetical protein
MQTLPHAPQLLVSVIRLEHPRPGQNSCPAGHICRHTATGPVVPPSPADPSRAVPASPPVAALDMQISPPAHCVLQVPQLRVSVRRLTQALLHTSGSLAGHRRHTLREEGAASIPPASAPPSAPASMPVATALAVQMWPTPQPLVGSDIAATSSGRQHR